MKQLSPEFPTFFFDSNITSSVPSGVPSLFGHVVSLELILKFVTVLYVVA
jgi:hypothetical protein